ncbi:MAG: RNA methyltransferase [Chitinophagia bacterium]|jgi:16S rRNA C967 or C1407 C5-methylase (RsmB/RsmF family)/NOL1/NOP2/fmu family ribosome biogenesis protein
MILPEALLRSLEVVPGYNRLHFEEVHNIPVPVTSIRLNPHKPFPFPEHWQTSTIPWCEEGRYLATRPSFTQDPFLHAGAYYVQEASSMFIRKVLSHLFSQNDPIHIADICAAPGGKSTLLASYFQHALLVSNEVIKTRTPILNENMVKWGAPNTIVTQNDPSQFKQLPGFFDLMLVDAPCSGSGLFRKDPAALDEWSEEQVLVCSRRQQRILADVLPALREGGILLYATCSYSTSENETITQWLRDEMDMECVTIPIDKSWGIVTSSMPGTFRFFPQLLKGEGFYLSVLRKKTAMKDEYLREVALVTPDKSISKLFTEKFQLADHTTLFKQGNQVRSISSHYRKAIQQLTGVLYIKRAGVELGEIKGKDLIPSHEWALQQGEKKGWPIVALSLSEALAYLGRQPLEFSAEGGWNLVSYQGCVLGWVKMIQNRINNYYPTQWRILKVASH